MCSGKRRSKKKRPWEKKKPRMKGECDDDRIAQTIFKGRRGVEEKRLLGGTYLPIISLQSRGPFWRFEAGRRAGSGLKLRRTRGHRGREAKGNIQSKKG